MNTTRRREFLAAVGGTAAAAALQGRVEAAAERTVLGLIGPGGMGMNHLRMLLEREDVEIAAVCDPDRHRLTAAADAVKAKYGKAPATQEDLRHLLADPRIEAVFIATPDHWHVPAAILALNAGKHVYVEKPCSHNLREGRALVDAARRSGKLVQVGTQSRSTAVVRDAIERIHRGAIGDVLVAKAWNSQRRGTIGKSQPADPPAHLNYDLWLGPAPAVAYRANMLPGVWRWWHAFGCGDIGNDGVHDIDVALWGLGATTHPSRVSCLGGKYFFDDDQQFPDTQYAVFEYPDRNRGMRTKQLIFEQRIWSPYVQEGYENGAAFYGTQGLMIIGHTVGWKLYGPRNVLIAERTGSADLKAHHDNFLACVRGREKTLNADALTGHISASLVHLANIAARVGRVLEFDPNSEKIIGDREAASMLGRKYRSGHWAVPVNRSQVTQPSELDIGLTG